MNMNEKNQPGIGMIGSGFVAYFHLFGIRSVGLGKFTAIAAYTQREADQRGRLFNAEAYSTENLDEMLARPDIDLFIIGTPNKLHAEHGMKAISAGKAILIEKPLTLTLAEADKLCAAQAAGARIGYAENHMHAPIIERARSLVLEGAVGRIRKITAYFGGIPISSLNWHYTPAVAGGGVFIDLTAHTIPACEFLAGETRIAEVSKADLRFDENTGIDTFAEVSFRTENDIEIVTESLFGAPTPGCHYKIEGDNGILTACFSPQQELMLKRKGHEPQVIDFPYAKDQSYAGLFIRAGYGPQILRFVQSLQNGTPFPISADFGRDTLHWLCAGYIAAATGQHVKREEPIPRDMTPLECAKAMKRCG